MGCVHFSRVHLCRQLDSPIILAQFSADQTKGECMKIVLNKIEIYDRRLCGAGISPIPAANIFRLLAPLACLHSNLFRGCLFNLWKRKAKDAIVELGINVFLVN